MCAHKFEAGKLQALRTVYDRLSLLEQSATGWLKSKVVDLQASQAESGLPQCIERCIRFLCPDT
jgi:hypothetical protein